MNFSPILMLTMLAGSHLKRLTHPITRPCVCHTCFSLWRNTILCTVKCTHVSKPSLLTALASAYRLVRFAVHSAHFGEVVQWGKTYRVRSQACFKRPSLNILKPSKFRMQYPERSRDTDDRVGNVFLRNVTILSSVNCAIQVEGFDEELINV